MLTTTAPDIRVRPAAIRLRIAQTVQRKTHNLADNRAALTTGIHPGSDAVPVINICHNIPEPSFEIKAAVVVSALQSLVAVIYRSIKALKVR